MNFRALLISASTTDAETATFIPLVQLDVVVVVNVSAGRA